MPGATTLAGSGAGTQAVVLILPSGLPGSHGSCHLLTACCLYQPSVFAMEANEAPRGEDLLKIPNWQLREVTECQLKRVRSEL